MVVSFCPLTIDWYSLWTLGSQLPFSPSTACHLDSSRPPGVHVLTPQPLHGVPCCSPDAALAVP
jgi:hypothetical protein